MVYDLLSFQVTFAQCRIEFCMPLEHKKRFYGVGFDIPRIYDTFDALNLELCERLCDGWIL